MEKNLAKKATLLAKRQAYKLHMEKYMKSTDFMAPITVAFSRDMIATVDRQLAELEAQ